MKLFKNKTVLKFISITCILFAGAGFVHAQVNYGRGGATTQKPENIRGSETVGSKETILREPCTLLPVAHVTHGSDGVNITWAEYDLISAQSVTAVLLDDSQSTQPGKAIYTVYTGTTPKPTHASRRVELGAANGQGIYIPFSAAAAGVHFVRVEQTGNIKNSAAIEHALVCGTGTLKNATSVLSKTAATTPSRPIITTPPNPSCPGGDLYLNKTELVVGGTLTAIAPPMWYDGTFASSNTGRVVVDGNIVRAVAPGTAEVYGKDFKGGNNRGCVTKAITVTVK